MTPQTQVGIALHQHAAVYRAVRVVAGDAALAQCLVLEDVRPGLLLVATDANGITLLRAQSAGDLVNVSTVRLVAVDTGHLPLEDAMMVRQGEFAVGRHVALETSLRFGAGIHDVGG